MNVAFAVFADAANNTQNGKLNLLGVFQTLHTIAVPCVVPRMSIVIVLRAELGEKGSEHSITIRIRDADGREITQLPTLPPVKVPLQDPRPNPEINMILELNNSVFEHFGQYAFEVWVDGQWKHTLELIVEPIVLPPEQLA
jgi:hypothetical protein